jgi:hypothetical protein
MSMILRLMWYLLLRRELQRKEGLSDKFESFSLSPIYFVLCCHVSLALAVLCFTLSTPLDFLCNSFVPLVFHYSTYPGI